MVELIKDLPFTDKKLIQIELHINENFNAVKLLKELVKQNKFLLKNNLWDKIFIIDDSNNRHIFGKFIKINGLLNIVKSVSHLMSQYGLTTDEITNDNINVEFHHAKFDKTDKKHKHPFFCVHRDDCGGIEHEVHTFIIYITYNLVEGNFAFYDDGYGNETDEPTIIINVQDVLKNNVKGIIFDGKLYHGIMPIVSGERYALSFQIKKSEQI